MIQAKPTEKLTGVTIQGDYDDFYQLTEAFHNAAGFEQVPKDPYYSVAMRVLGVCYDIRKAYQGDREVTLKDNGMHEEIMKYHSLIAPKENVYYSVNILFPEVLFAAMSVRELLQTVHTRTGRKNVEMWDRTYSQAMYMRDKAVIDMFCAGIWEAFSDVVGNEEADKVIRLFKRTDESYYQYASLYVDRLNVEYLKADVKKRTDKLRNIAKRIAKKPDAYYKMEAELKYWAKEHNATIHDAVDTSSGYPEEIEW